MLYFYFGFKQLRKTRNLYAICKLKWTFIYWVNIDKGRGYHKLAETEVGRGRDGKTSYSATSIYQYVIQVVLSTGIFQLCAQV